MDNLSSLEMLSIVAQGLKRLKDQVAFVGGAAVALHVTDKAAPPLRPTDDVDCVVEVASLIEYGKLGEELSRLGFKHPLSESAPICRWKFSGLNVDVMPTDEQALGFRNRWYGEGLKESQSFSLPSGIHIKAFTLPYLLASKIEAFLGRGEGDFRLSHDMEDVFALIDGAPKAEEEIGDSPARVQEYIKRHFSKFLEIPLFSESAEAHLQEVGRARRAMDIIRKLSQREH